MSSVQKVNFTGASRAINVARVYGEAGQIALKNDLTKEIDTFMPKSIRVFQKNVKKLVGEIPNIIITAIGTAFIAPIFIKWNPLSKTDEETRTYSALRQPVSAVLAVLTQVGLSKPIEKLITHLSNTGYFDNERMCKTALQDKAYLEKIIKKNKPTISKDQLKIEVENKHYQQIEDIFTSIYDDNTIKYLKDGKLKHISKEGFSHLIKSTVLGLVKDIDGNIKRLQIEKPAFKQARGEFYRTHSSDAKALFDEVEAFVEKATDKKELDNFFKTKIKTLKEKGANKELLKMVDDIRYRDGAVGVAEKIKAMRESCDFFSKLGSFDEVKVKVMERIDAKVLELSSEKKLLNEIKDDFAGGKTISQLKDKIASLSETKFVTSVVEKYASNIEGSLKGFRNLSSTILSLAILPVTACLLNEIYPWFMDTCFPELSKTKHSKEKGKLVAKAKEKSTEVQK